MSMLLQLSIPVTLSELIFIVNIGWRLQGFLFRWDCENRKKLVG